MTSLVLIRYQPAIVMNLTKHRSHWQTHYIFTDSVLDRGEYSIAMLESERWQALAAVLPPGGPRVSRWRAQGEARQNARLGACQCYYMFFTVQPKIAIFMAHETMNIP